jgi:hypothetical protein
VNAQKDRLQAHAIAVAIFPEIVAVKANLERARDLSSVAFPSSKEKWAWLIRQRKLDEPPLIRDMADQIFILGDAGATSLQLLGVVLLYNEQVETLAKAAEKEAERAAKAASATTGGVDVPAALGKFSDLLDQIEKLAEMADKKISPIYKDVQISS